MQTAAPKRQPGINLFRIAWLFQMYQPKYASKAAVGNTPIGLQLRWSGYQLIMATSSTAGGSTNTVWGMTLKKLAHML